MKKLLLALTLVICLFASQVQAANVIRKGIMDTTFNAVTTTAYSDTVSVGGYDKVAFFILYDETAVGNNPAATITLEISYDATNWMDASWKDYAGGDTLVTSEVITTDLTYYYGWFNRDLHIPYMRLKVVASNTDEDDLINIKAYIVAKE